MNAPVRLSAVMGRTAVAVVIAFWQLPAIGYLAGLTGSVSISNVGGSSLAAVWSVCFLTSAALMITVYRLKSETDKAVCEIGALVVFTAAMLVYLAAILDRSSGLDGVIAVLALTGSLIVNMTGRAVLLLRQVRFVVRSRHDAL